MPVMKLPRMGGKVSELRDHFLRMTDRSPICPSSSTRVGVEKRSPRSRDARRVSWDIYDYVLAISRTPSLESCASPEPEELVMSAVLLYQEGDVLRLEAETDSATLTSKFGRMEEVFGEYGALFTRGESLLVNGIKAELTPRGREEERDIA
ncbi:hypothetical protein T484DRAFT_1917892 [Baffinella frigidus]|nr:hypothetical protein T484DRAFT_1917892 [Cryptophyta sp. CCMP2293]